MTILQFVFVYLMAGLIMFLLFADNRGLMEEEDLENEFEYLMCVLTMIFSWPLGLIMFVYDMFKDDNG